MDIDLQIILNIIFTASIYLLIANSFSIIYYATKFFHIAHAAVITYGAYFTLVFAKQLSFPFFLSIILGVASATCIGIMCEIFVYRRMREKKSPALAYLISSIGLYIVLQNCISLCFGDETKIIRIGDIKIGNQFFGAYITTIQVIIISASAILFLIVNFFLQFSRIGKSIRAVSSNPELCNIYGINSTKVIFVVFCIGSSLAALAGILLSMDTNMTPTFGFNLLLYGVVVMIIGGIGNTKSLVIGAFLVAITQHLAAYYIDTKWTDAVTYTILILFLIWKPLGFSGKHLRKVEI